jgi:2-C-methyl-D-erythritol 4-phosphate cytidylyltransferase
MAFMLRADAARSLVHEELRERLVALACLVGGSEAASSSRDTAIAEANSFVNDVLAAVDKAKYD